MADWYWPGLLIAGVAQVVDGYCLYRARGHINTGSAVSGGIEFGWLVVSIFVLATGRVDGAAAVAAIVYVSYNLAGMVQGIVLIRRSADIDTFTVPRWMVLLSVSVGLGFAVVALARLVI